METTQKIIIAIFLFGGFLWIRQRARTSDRENIKAKTIFGVFILLPGLLIGLNALFNYWQIAPYTDLLLKVLALVTIFFGIGYFFLKPAKSGPS